MKIKADKYTSVVMVLFIVVALLTHFQELISLYDHPGHYNLFPGTRLVDVLTEILFTFLSLLFLFAMNTYLFGYNNPKVRITWIKMVSSFILTGVVSNILGNGFFYLHSSFDLPAIEAVVHHYLHPLRDLIITGIVCGSCFIIHLIRKSQQVTIENEQLRIENLVNQYEALKNQLNPHMLFNSLNTLSSLIHETPNKAQDYLQELSHVLRYTLRANESISVTLQEEMEFVHAYNFLLKMRYEENIEFDIQIDKDMETRSLPPMSVQLLIENAVKHNEISNKHPLLIQIQTTGNQLTVSNPIQRKKSAETGMQIGLANLSKRYNLLFKEEIKVSESNNMFRVTIPLI